MKPKANIFHHRWIKRSTSRSMSGEAGISLFLALLLTVIASMLAAGVIFATQTEIWTTANYRTATQARYVAEAGAEQAAEWILKNWTPGGTFSSSVNLKVFPAQYVNGTTSLPVVLATTTMGTIVDTYGNIDSATDGRFKTALQGVTGPFTRLSGNATFNVAAQLLTATQVSGTTTTWYSKWKIISQGSVGYLQPAKVQVVEVITESPLGGTGTQPISPYSYAVLATGTGCNSVSSTGGTSSLGFTNSYNSQAAGNPGNSNPTIIGSGGSVASFGNINITNGAYVNGSVYSPFYNYGTAGEYGVSCPTWTAACGNNGTGWNGAAACVAPTSTSPGQVWSVNEDKSGSAVGCTSGASCTNTVSNMPPSLPNPSSVPTPDMPSVTPNTSTCTALAGNLCNGGSGGGGGCAATLPPSPAGTSYGQANFGSCAVITLQAGTYNFDTLAISNGAKINVPSNGSVVINILNSSNASTPLNYSGGTAANPGGDPNNLTFVYAGSNNINIQNGAAMFATVYAPNATVQVSGNGGLYGAVVGKTFAFTGSGHVIYDTHLGSETPHVTYTGAHVPVFLRDEFSWSAY
jgi:hypothetical protein